MKELFVEWRKFLKENKTKPLKEFKSASAKDAGISIGEMLKNQIKDAVKNYKIEKLIEDFSDWMDEGKSLSKKYTPISYEFVEGIAEGSDIDFDHAFGMWYEELWFAKEEDKKKIKDEGCTDVFVKNDDDLLMGHTNDESPGDGSRLLKLSIKDKVQIYASFTRGVPSIGLNSKGLVFSGCQVDANDTRPGIPRMMLYMEALFSETLKEAEKLLLHPKRASSFANVIADENGEIITLEGSATKKKKVVHDDGIGAHANHFIWLKDKEGREGESLKHSNKRLKRALEDAKEEGRKMSVDDMKELLSSHGEGALCRHVEDEKDTATVFSVIFLPKERKFFYGDGNPCETEYIEVKY
jgi:predicted choloylglycine hydrolase